MGRRSGYENCESFVQLAVVPCESGAVPRSIRDTSLPAALTPLFRICTPFCTLLMTTLLRTAKGFTAEEMEKLVSQAQKIKQK